MRRTALWLGLLWGLALPVYPQLQRNINIDSFGYTRVPTGLIDVTGLLVRCPTCSGGGGTTGTPADGFANPGAISENMIFGMLYNGTTWDRWRGDATSGAWVNVKNTITVTANAGTNLNTSALALEATQLTGNTSLASIKANTDPLVTAGAGAYFRQDSTATIAKESGGNLAAIATNTTGMATAVNQTTGNSSLSTIVANTTGVSTAVNQTTINTSINALGNTLNGASVHITGPLSYVYVNPLTKAMRIETPSVNQGSPAPLSSGWPMIQGVGPSTSALWSSSTPANSALAVPMSGYSGVIYSQTSNSGAGATITFEVSYDNQATWYAAPLFVVSDITVQYQTWLTSGSTGSYVYGNNFAGATHFRARINPTLSSGTLQVRIVVVPTSPQETVKAEIGPKGSGIPDANTPRIKLAERATYAAALTIKTATVAGTAPWFSICGSSTKTVRIQLFQVSGTVATAGVFADVELTKTSTVTSGGGTPTAMTAVPTDSSSVAATVGLLNFYPTTLATAGTAVGKIAAQMQWMQITAVSSTSVTIGQVIFDWRTRSESEAPVLRGTAQCMEASFGTTTTNAPILLPWVVWTEE